MRWKFKFPLKIRENHCFPPPVLWALMDFIQGCVFGRRKWKRVNRQNKTKKIQNPQNLVKNSPNWTITEFPWDFYWQDSAPVFFFFYFFPFMLHDWVWGLLWYLQMFCAWNVGKRSQSRLQMGAAILGKLYEQLWRGMGPARILIIRRSGGGVLLHALGIIVDAVQTMFIHSTCLSDSLHRSVFFWMVLLDDWIFFNKATIIFIRKLPHYSCIMPPHVTLKQPHFSGISGVFLYLHLNCLARSGD